MNMQEFAALKVGDKIENPMNGSTGEVTATSDGGVRVVWGRRMFAQAAPSTSFFYSVQSTAWMHWRKAENAGPEQAPEAASGV